MLLYVFHGCVTFDPINDKISKEIRRATKTIPHDGKYNTLIFFATPQIRDYVRLRVRVCVCVFCTLTK